jgi:hypothetical protein
MTQALISLSDESLNQITQLARPLEPQARSAFLVALAAELQDVPQPVADGAVSRAARSLLATGRFHRAPEFVVGSSYGTAEAKYRVRSHYSLSRQRNCEHCHH